MNSRKLRKFGRKRGERQSFLKGLMQNLIMEERIQTTEARAKDIKPRLERLVSIAKRNDLASLRFLLSRLPNKKSALKLYYEIAPRYAERRGGYLRITKTIRTRKRDAAHQTVIEFV